MIEHGIIDWNGQFRKVRAPSRNASALSSAMATATAHANREARNVTLASRVDGKIVQHGIVRPSSNVMKRNA